ncbi:hypothetical protein N7493_000768 [Penicillium malachiteum]|uniref:Zn(2)-C6 fungal-type domain-containing protein n=1 Tax=Penicillium malachiteum TaxID=1324776 RepID=A0AAD6HWZ0_9EURO|nr:hypothetical protein N7493_000768 [Penicillium malachiteum]
MADSGISARPHISTANLEPKRHAACDECRKRKLKCSGEPSGCSRCLKQCISCNYSIQKPMGRPKKRARADDKVPVFSTQSNENIWPSPEDTPPDSFSIAPDPIAASDAHHLCPQLFWQSQGPSAQPDLYTSSHEPDRSKNPNLPIPTSSSPWPDFSTVSQSSAMPFTSSPNISDLLSMPITPQSPNSDPTVPQCTCLSYLYLCLSHISSIASFPVTNHTLCSLYIAARTARDIIRCESCPKNFASGVQNVMFCGTLLTVVADAWFRVYQSDPVELGMQSAPQDYISFVLQSEDPAQQWTSWLRQIVRRAVIGGPVDPSVSARCKNQPALLALINEVENRQRRWHEPGVHPCPNNPFSPGVGQMMNGDDCEGKDEKELLCFRVVGSARAVISKFNFEAHEFPEGTDLTGITHGNMETNK